MHLLLVEDDTLIGEGLYLGFKRMDYQVDWVKNGESGLDAMLSKEYDVVILDIGLPRMSGIDVLKTARAKKYTNPILLLTAQDALEQKVEGLDAGADDYLVKPFQFQEVCARVRALERRIQVQFEDTFERDDLIVNYTLRTVHEKGVVIELSRREYDLLEILLKSLGQIFSKAQLESKLYGWNDDVSSNTIEVHVHHLRKKIACDLIKTSRGIGYYVQKPIN